MTSSPNEAELEIIFERLRQEYLTSLEDVRSDAAMINNINQGLRFWPLKNLGTQSKDRVREIGTEKRGTIKIRIQQDAARSKRQVRPSVAKRRRLIGVRGTPWTYGQIVQIRELYSKDAIPVSRIAYKTGRTERAVYMKAYRLGLKRKRG